MSAIPTLSLDSLSPLDDLGFLDSLDSLTTPHSLLSDTSLTAIGCESWVWSDHTQSTADPRLLFFSAPLSFSLYLCSSRSPLPSPFPSISVHPPLFSIPLAPFAALPLPIVAPLPAVPCPSPAPSVFHQPPLVPSNPLLASPILGQIPLCEEDVSGSSFIFSEEAQDCSNVTLHGVEYLSALSPTLSSPATHFLDLQQIEQELNIYNCYDGNARDFFTSASDDFDSSYSAHPSPSTLSIPFLDDIILSVKEQIQQETELLAPLSHPSSSPSICNTHSTSHSPSPSHSDSPTLSPYQYQTQDDSSVDESGRSSPSVSVSPTNNKRKRSCSSECEDTPSSSSSSSAASQPPTKKIPISLASLSPEEVAERKREQNRVAALKYRAKQRSTIKTAVSEISQLSDRNAFLRVESERLDKEVKSLKVLLFSQFGMSA